MVAGTIPAREIVSVVPGVIGAGGTGLVLQGLVLTSNTRVPIGVAQPFADPNDVENYFGGSSDEFNIASIYFLGFTNSNIKPGSVLYAQYPQTAVAAWLRGGKVSGLTLQQLQGLSGTLTVIADGTPRVAGSLNLSAATSFSSAAALIQAGLNGSPATLASVTGSIAPGTAVSCTGSITGNVLTVTALASGILVPGMSITGSGVTATLIRNQLSGTTGGIGTYAVSVSQNAASTTLTGAVGLLTVTAIGSGTLSVGQKLSGAGVTAGTQITALGTGTGLTGTYYVTPSQTASSTTITATPVDVAVTYDSVSGAFVVTSGIVGAASLMAFATGTVAAALMLTQATGAVVSQGSPGVTPAAFMTNFYANVSQNWATFMLVQDPDNGSGNVQKMAFSTWNAENQLETAFICWDTDITPTVSVPASSSMGQLLAANQADGTCLIWGTDYTKAAFICGYVAAIDFTEQAGRATAAFKSQGGLVADVTTETIANNLLLNFYNFYGAYGTANEEFVFFNPGSISGEFKWVDSYINQIWLNNELQLAMMVLLTTAKSIPYNSKGYGLIEAACLDPINAAVNFGAIQAGVLLSALQADEVNAAAGKPIDKILFQRGWYLQILPASAQVRIARGSPPATLWYMDGQSVQKINLASVEVQ